jgi:hypothetical protein
MRQGDGDIDDGEQARSKQMSNPMPPRFRQSRVWTCGRPQLPAPELRCHPRWCSLSQGLLVRSRTYHESRQQAYRMKQVLDRFERLIISPVQSALDGIQQIDSRRLPSKPYLTFCFLSPTTSDAGSLTSSTSPRLEIRQLDPIYPSIAD